MTTQLPERLRALADEAPGALSGPDPWQVGRRRQRTRVATSLAVAGALVLAVVLVGFGDRQSRRPDPAAPPATNAGPMAIPDRFFTPSPWLPSTSNPGRLVGVIPEVSRHRVIGGPTDGVVGVAAGSQRYAFLDLPDRLPGSQVLLAPDGLHLAYMVEGTVSEARDSYAPGGVAVLDLDSGHVDTFLIDTQHGINNAGLVWADPSTLFFQELHAVDGPGHRQGFGDGAYRVDLGSPRLVPLGHRFVADSQSEVNLPRGLAYLAGARRIQLLDPISARRTHAIHLNRSINLQAALNGSGDRVAGLAGSGSPAALLAGPVRRGEGTLRIVGGATSLWDWVPGWADAHHVVAERVVPRGRLPRRLSSVDIRTGASTTLSTYRGDVQVARNAISHPRTVAAVAPPQPWNRRAELIMLLVLVALGGVALLVTRSRRVRR